MAPSQLNRMAPDGTDASKVQNLFAPESANSLSSTCFIDRVNRKTESSRRVREIRRREGGKGWGVHRHLG